MNFTLEQCKPFDLEKAELGCPVVAVGKTTGKLYSVEFIRFDHVESSPIYTILKGSLSYQNCAFPESGIGQGHELLMAPERKTYWYIVTDHGPHVVAFDSEIAAEDHAKTTESKHNPVVKPHTYYE